MLNRTVPPAFQSIKDITIIQPEEIVYKNGLKAFVFQAESLDLLKFEFTFANIYTQEELAYLNPILSSMLKEGTQTLSSKEIADTIDFYGAYLMPEYSLDHTSLTLYTMHKYADKVLPIMADILRNASLPQKELSTYIRNNKQSLQISLQKNDVLARRYFYDAVFRGTRYGVLPTEEKYDAVTREQLLNLFQHQIYPSNCTLFIAGRVDKPIHDLVSQYFGEDWKNEQKELNANALSFDAHTTEVVVVEKPEALQSAIRLGTTSIRRAHEDFPALQFVNTLFGGFFGSRLMRNIREEKGYTYSIGSYVGNLKYTGFFTIATEVGVASTQDTLKEIATEFDRLRSEPPQQEEVDLVRNYMQGVMLGSLESIFSHVDKFKATYFSGLTLDYYRYYSDVLKAMTPAKVQDIAIKYFDYDKLYKVVVGKM